MDVAGFFGKLQEKMTAVGEEHRRSIHKFFIELAPRLDAARKLDKELNRQIAHKFNTFDYLKTDELGLSRIIANLLNPLGTHGQGATFLNILLANLECTRNWIELNSSTADVTLEFTIEANRRIDIYVRITDTSDKNYCIAIENKPYAGDQENQVRDYLEHLSKRFPQKYLLIYLSPTGEPPSDWSLGDTNMQDHAGHFAVMAYNKANLDGDVNVRGARESESWVEYRESLTLTDWLSLCRQRCDADRLRWFLSEAITFCQKSFGSQLMSSDLESNSIKEYLIANPDGWQIAFNVLEVLPQIREQICRDFLQIICNQIKVRLKDDHRFKDKNSAIVDFNLRSTSPFVQLWIYSSSWKNYKNSVHGVPNSTLILLRAHVLGPSDWAIGVGSPEPITATSDVDDIRRRDELDKELSEVFEISPKDESHSNHWWPYFDKPEDKIGDWSTILSDLATNSETAKQKSDYIVNRMIDIASKSFPIIEKVER